MPTDIALWVWENVLDNNNNNVIKTLDVYLFSIETQYC